ncbi:MAG: hypothetical protein ACFBWO_06540 [Paracoccaceae bacterium]
MTAYRLPLIAALVALASPVAALGEVTEAEREALGSRIDAFVDHLQSGDHGAMLDMLPPEVWGTIAENAGVEEAEVKEAMVAQVTAAMADVDFEETSYDLDGARFGTTEADRDWAVVPVAMTIVSGGESVEIDGELVGLVDDGDWYLMRIEAEQQAALLGAAYPDMQGVELTR